MSDLYELSYQNKTILFTLTKSAKRRTIAIQVYRDKVVVRAPSLVSMRQILAFVEDKAPWLLLQQEKLANLPKPIKLSYQHGAMHSFLGEDYPLKLYVGGAHEIALKRDAIHITSPNRLLSSQIKAKLERWYMKQGHRVFPEYVNKWHAHPKFAMKTYPELTIRRMRRRWGSLSSEGNMTLNSMLIKAPSSCIDYVVLHEFCHMYHFDHSPAFYHLLSSLMPDWKVQKQLLKQYAYGLVSEDVD